MSGMKFIKAFVIGCGILLIIGTAVLFTRAAKQAGFSRTPQPSIKTITETTITVAPGSQIHNVISTSQGLALWAKHPDGNAEILLLDHSGNLSKRITVNHREPKEANHPPAPQTPEN